MKSGTVSVEYGVAGIRTDVYVIHINLFSNTEAGLALPIVYHFISCTGMVQ
jgi:hypothetical protein